jgi:hypothetical protein
MQCIVTYATVCSSSFLKSVLRYKFLIFDTYHSDTIYLREQRCEDPWLFSEAKSDPRAKTFGNHCSTRIPASLPCPETLLEIMPRKSFLYGSHVCSKCVQGIQMRSGKFGNVVLEKDGEDQLDRSCEK